MKNIYLILLFFLLPTAIIAQKNISNKWIKNIEGNGWNYINKSINYKDGCVLSGSFTKRINGNRIKGKSIGGEDFFILYISENGQVKKFIAAGSKKDDKITAITKDSVNNIYISGIIRDTLFLGKEKIPVKEKSLFIAKIDNKFKPTWIQLFPSNSITSFDKLQVFKDKLLLVGSFHDMILKDTTKIKAITQNDIIIAKLDLDNGKLEQIKSFDIKGDNSNVRIQPTDSAYYVISQTKSLRTNKQLKEKHKNITTINITKLSFDFKIKWIKNIKSHSFIKMSDYYLDRKECLYITGIFEDKIVLNNKSYSSKGLKDSFLYKFDHNGNIIYGKTFGGEGNDCIYSLKFINEDNPLLVGDFDYEFEMDGILLQKEKRGTIFLIQINPDNGQNIWSKTLQQSNICNNKTCSINKDGEIYLAGLSFANSNNSISGKIFISKHKVCIPLRKVIKGDFNICPESHTTLSVSRRLKKIIWNDSITDSRKFRTNKIGQNWIKAETKSGCPVYDTIAIKALALPEFKLSDSLYISEINMPLRITLPNEVETCEWPNGQVGKVIILNNTTPGLYHYNLKMTTKDACYLSDTLKVLIKNNLNNSKVNKTKTNLLECKEDIIISPNPAKDIITIQSTLESNITCKLNVYDSTGQIVINDRIKPDNKISLDISFLNPGVYYIELINKSKKHIASFIKQ